MLLECLTRSFACEIHIFCCINLTSQFSRKTLMFYFFAYTHAGNTLLVDNTTYKTCSMAHIMPFFGTPLMVVVGRTIICWGLFSLTWKTFIHLDIMFPPLLNTIPLVRLDVMIEIIQDFVKCYFWNEVKLANLIFVTMRNWNWKKKTLLIVHLQIFLVWIFKNFPIVKFIKIYFILFLESFLYLLLLLHLDLAWWAFG
jgi:hypothetical protein